MPAERRHKKTRTLTQEQREERFDAGGRSFSEALKAVLTGGRGDDHDPKADEREADK